MPARRCLKCSINWPAGKGSAVKCPECGDILPFSSHSQAERDYPPQIPEVLPDLSDDERQELEADWAALRAEQVKRGDKWSLADLIAEGPSDRAA